MNGVMSGDAEGQRGLGDLAAACLHLAECVEGALVHVMPVDPEQRGAVLAVRDLVRRPQLVEQCLRAAHGAGAIRGGLVETPQ